eukprot:SAG31_NODE_8787_length_1387_cov_1.850155_1_plen_121_part_10
MVCGVIVLALGLHGVTLVYAEVLHKREFGTPHDDAEQQQSDFSKAEQSAFEAVLLDRHFANWLVSLLVSTGLSCVAVYTLLNLDRLDKIVEERFRRQYVSGVMETAYIDHEVGKLQRNQIA